MKFNIERLADLEPETVETWINGELITLNLEQVWSDTFAQWDALVDTDTAAAIASAVAATLRAKAAILTPRKAGKP